MVAPHHVQAEGNFFRPYSVLLDQIFDAEVSLRLNSTSGSG